MACSTFTDLTYVSVFSLGRTTTSFFHTPSKRSSISVLVSFISSLSAMTVNEQIPERETAPTLPVLSVPPFETAVKRKKIAFWPPSGQIFVKALKGELFVRMHIIGCFLCFFTKICFHTSCNHVGGI